MIGGFCKSYNAPFDVALYDISFANIAMYSAVIPSLDAEQKGKEIINADNPRNREKIERVLFG